MELRLVTPTQTVAGLGQGQAYIRPAPVESANFAGSESPPSLNILHVSLLEDSC